MSAVPARQADRGQPGMGLLALARGLWVRDLVRDRRSPAERGAAARSRHPGQDPQGAVRASAWRRARGSARARACRRWRRPVRARLSVVDGEAGASSRSARQWAGLASLAPAVAPRSTIRISWPQQMSECALGSRSGQGHGLTNRISAPHSSQRRRSPAGWGMSRPPRERDADRAPGPFGGVRRSGNRAWHDAQVVSNRSPDRCVRDAPGRSSPRAERALPRARAAVLRRSRQGRRLAARSGHGRLPVRTLLFVAPKHMRRASRTMP